MALESSILHRKRRFLAIVAIVLLVTSLAPVAVLAADPLPTNFNYVEDDQGANDEPGQKDLTAQSSLNFDGNFWTAWKWDDTAWNGNNTGDGCSLFDTGTKNGFVNFAVCGTVEDKDPVTLFSVSLYSCSDKRPDRCTNPELEFTTIADAGDFCIVNDEFTGQFGGTDTQIQCNITLLAAEATPPITVLTGGTLLNTCSYPSKEPNSDPSDCVLTSPPVQTSTATDPSGTASWSVTLSDEATLTPADAAGNVVFKLWGTNTSGTCGNLVWTSPSIAVNTTTGKASTNGGGTPNNGNTITNLTFNDADGVYYWTADFTPTDPGDFDPSSSACGAETATITPASVTASP